MTRVYVVRHAVAVDRAPGVPDAERPLTERGRRDFAKAAKCFRALGVRFDRLLHSPRLRAIETAEELARYVDGETIVTANLARAPSARLLAEIRGEHVAVVGHEPHLGALAAWLVTGARAHGDHFALRKGGVMVLDGEPRPAGMALVGCLTPKWMRRLGKG